MSIATKARLNEWEANLLKKQQELLAKQEQLNKKIESGWDENTWRELNLVNYKLEVLENRINGTFVDPVLNMSIQEVQKV